MIMTMTLKQSTTKLTWTRSNFQKHSTQIEVSGNLNNVAKKVFIGSRLISKASKGRNCLLVKIMGPSIDPSCDFTLKIFNLFT